MNPKLTSDPRVLGQINTKDLNELWDSGLFELSYFHGNTGMWRNESGKSRRGDIRFRVNTDNGVVFVCGEELKNWTSQSDTDPDSEVLKYIRDYMVEELRARFNAVIKVLKRREHDAERDAQESKNFLRGSVSDETTRDLSSL